MAQAVFRPGDGELQIADEVGTPLSQTSCHLKFVALPPLPYRA